ncbi:hypothetical protein IKQ38_01855 [Candidatus Saccharibacteria bacterium]|nr:hypothetical protein [Candidatus Saccharibacteria bacterium]
MGGVAKKSKLKQALSKMFHFSTWKLVLVLILMCFVAATLLRIDHIRMTELKNAVMEADASNDDEAIASSLVELQTFTRTHIIFNYFDENGEQKIIFGTGAFYLENQYNRKANEALKVAQEKINQQGGNMNEYNVHKKVAEICDAEAIKHGWRYPNINYINCFVNELAKYPEADQLTVAASANLPSTDLFRYDYASPMWYPCASGIVILICVILLIIVLVRFVIWIGLQIAIFAVNHT